jgi:hypothetical protein
VYTKNRAIPLADPIYSDDLYLGHISADTVAPPHIANSIKYCISSAENIDEIRASTLFVSILSETPIGDTGCVLILEYPGPGCTPNDLIVLFTELSSAIRSPFKANKPWKVLQSS